MPVAVASFRCPSARSSFTRDQLISNFRAVLDELQRVKPAAAKGRYVKSVAMSSTMGPGVDVDPARLRIAEEDLAGSAAR